MTIPGKTTTSVNALMSGLPVVVTADLLYRYWDGAYYEGVNFRCYLCGTHLTEGKKVRCVPTGEQNIFVCNDCDDIDRDNTKVIERWRKLVDEFNAPRFWKLRDQILRATEVERNEILSEEYLNLLRGQI